MLAAQDMVETVDVVVMAEEVAAEVPVQPCLGRHQRLVPAKIERDIFSPLAQAIRAKMGICS